MPTTTDRLSTEDRERITTAVDEYAERFDVGTRVETNIIDATMRLGAHAIGCSLVDLRDPELDYIEQRARIAHGRRHLNRHNLRLHVSDNHHGLAGLCHVSIIIDNQTARELVAWRRSHWHEIHGVGAGHSDPMPRTHRHHALVDVIADAQRYLDARVMTCDVVGAEWPLDDLGDAWRSHLDQYVTGCRIDLTTSGPRFVS